MRTRSWSAAGGDDKSDKDNKTEGKEDEPDGGGAKRTGWRH